MKYPVKTYIYRKATRLYDNGWEFWFIEVIRDWAFNSDLYE